MPKEKRNVPQQTIQGKQLGEVSKGNVERSWGGLQRNRAGGFVTHLHRKERGRSRPFLFYFFLSLFSGICTRSTNARSWKMRAEK
jgi:hypothetical protein